MLDSKKVLNIVQADLYSSITGTVYNEHIVPLLRLKKNVIAFNLLDSSEIRFPIELKVFCAKGRIIKYIKNLLIISKEKNTIFNFHAVHLSIFLIIGMVFSSIRNLKKIHTVHTSFGNYKFRNKIFALLSYLIADKVIFCSLSSFESHPILIKKYLEKKYVVIQNAVNLDEINKVSKGVTENRKTITFVGRLIKIKNPIFLLKTYLELFNFKDIDLQFIGEGELKDELKEIISKNNLEKNVKLLGLIEREKVYKKLKKTDLFVSTSYIEGLPIAVLEAIGCKCSIFLSNIPPHKEIAKKIPNITLFENDNIIELKTLIQSHFDITNNQLKKELEENYKSLEINFSINKMLEKYEEEYNKL